MMTFQNNETVSNFKRVRRGEFVARACNVFVKTAVNVQFLAN